MEILVQDVGNVLIYDIEGEIDLYHAPKLRDMINKNVEEGNFNLILNLTNVSYIDSYGIGVLISTISNLKSRNGNLLLTNLGSQIKRVFDLSRLTPFFKIFDDVDQALNSFI